MTLDHDDLPIGRLLTRREALTLMGATGVVLLTGCSPNDVLGGDEGPCAVRPTLTEGPYFVDELLDRSDIRSEPSTGMNVPGALLALTFNVSRIASPVCTPLPGVQVDLWHCDALGVYSDATDPNFNTVGQKFLRGYQLTDSGGGTRFTTIYPGWYPGRAVHIHFKLRAGTSELPGFDFTSQLFFNDSFTDQVHTLAPYSSKGQGRLRNSGDGIYNSGGSRLVLAAAPTSEGYAATFNIALQI